MSDWEQWDEWGEVDPDWAADWEPWQSGPGSDWLGAGTKGGQRRYPRRMAGDGKRPRDEYLRPIVDLDGIRDRLSPDRITTEERLLEEFEGNRQDSVMGVKFAGGANP